MSDLGSSDLETYAERTGIPLAAPDDTVAPVPETVVVVGEAITLDLGSGAAAWDDSELVNAWDAAAEEFKLHNPGPGTWLDKATAALAIGKPLPGAKHGESKWYTETPPAKPTAVNPYAAQPAQQRTGGGGGAYTEPPLNRKKSTIKSNLKRKRKRDSQYAPSLDPPLDDGGGSIDMSLDEETISPPRPRAHVQPAPGSPAYTPNSPTLYPSVTPAGPQLPDRLRNPYLSHPPPPHQSHHPQSHAPAPRNASPTTSGIYPPMGTSSATPLTREEATTRAVNAQWWAGYWFAMSEVMPSVSELERTQEALQR